MEIKYYHGKGRLCAEARYPHASAEDVAYIKGKEFLVQLATDGYKVDGRMRMSPDMTESYVTEL